MRDFSDEVNRVTNMLINDGYFWIRTMWGSKWYSSPDGKIELPMAENLKDKRRV